jgi:hypothetical protein
MRLMPIMLALLLAGPAAASEDWKEYEYPDYSFTVHFPADPKIETTTYQASGGQSFEARVYSAAQIPARSRSPSSMWENRGRAPTPWSMRRSTS